jgi:hypothetical protein
MPNEPEPMHQKQAELKAENQILGAQTSHLHSNAVRQIHTARLDFSSRRG